MSAVPTSLRRAARRGACLLVLVSASAARAHAQAPPADPFAAGLRWSVEPAPAAPWIPRHLALAAEDLVWSAGEGAARALFAVPLDARAPAAPLFSDAPSAAGVGALELAAARSGARLFSAVQQPVPDELHRRTLVRAHEPAAAAQGAPFAPSWEHELLADANGPARLACDRSGALLVAAAFDAQRGFARIDWLEGASGALRARLERDASSLGGLAVCEDGSRAFVVLGTRLLVLDASGFVLTERELGASTRALAPTADGRHLLVGGLWGLSYLGEGAGGWSEERFVPGQAGELVSALALSPDGATWAIGWWRYAAGTSLRFELRDGASGAQLVELVQSSPAGSPQNLPQVVRVTRDGRRAALGAWGGGPDPEVVVVSREGGAPLFALDLPGSVEDLLLDERGERVVVASKSVHANALGGMGSLRSYALGGRDLVQLEPAGGAHLELAARGPAHATCLFLVGRRRPGAVARGPLAGLWLEREARLLVLPRPSDAQGVATLSVDLPGGSGLAGRLLWGQALFRTGAGAEFGASVEALLLL